jgi:hypothetical protein
MLGPLGVQNCIILANASSTGLLAERIIRDTELRIQHCNRCPDEHQTGRTHKKICICMKKGGMHNLETGDVSGHV